MINEFKGKVLALASGIGFAGLTICMRKEKNGNPIHAVLIGNILTFAACIPFYSNGINNEVEQWLLMIFLGFIQLGASYILYSIAIKYVTALDAIIYPVVEPVFNPILAYLMVDESMSPESLIGGFFVLAGVIGREIKKNQS